MVLLSSFRKILKGGERLGIRKIFSLSGDSNIFFSIRIKFHSLRRRDQGKKEKH